MSENNPPEKCLVCGGTSFKKSGRQNVKGEGYFQRWECKTEGCATSVKGAKL